MARSLAVEFGLYGACPAAGTVALAYGAGWSAQVPVGPDIPLIAVVHLGALGLLMSGRSGKGRNVDYAEHAYALESSTSGTDVQALVETGLGGYSPLQRRLLFYSVTVLALSLTALAYRFSV